MMKKTISLLLSTALCLCFMPIESVSAEDTDPNFKGNGTESDPFQIDSAYRLRLLAELINNPETNPIYRSAHFIQMKDIDLENKNFTPIGIYYDYGNESVFAGVYDGNYKSINNFYISTDQYYVGLFGRIGGYEMDNSNCVVKNLSLYGTVNATDGKSECVGSITGEIGYGANVTNCSFIGEVHNGHYTGGISGSEWCGGSTIDCYANAVVSSGHSSAHIGGIIGNLAIAKNAIIGSTSYELSNCYSAGEIQAVEGQSAGGIIGYVDHGDANPDATLTIKNNYYLSTSANYGVGSEKSEDCMKLSAILLSDAHELLGTPYTKNNDSSFNNGYPIFEWQSTPYQFKGSGTKEDPYQISNKNELKAMRDLVNSQFFSTTYNNKYYIQTDDIDLEKEDWTPIGTFCINNTNYGNLAFIGVYNGNHHSIVNLNVNKKDNYAGLFGRLGQNTSGTICNLSVVGTVNADTHYVGGICGEVAFGSVIESCSFSGSVSGSARVGGITGKIYMGGNVRSCYSNAAVTGTSQVGGIIGSTEANSKDVSIDSVYHVGKISSDDGKEGSILGNCQIDTENPSTVSLTNCYTLNGDSKNNIVVSGTPTENYTLIRTSSELKAIAEDLGEDFRTNSNSTVNDGYPVFYWQLFDNNTTDIIYGDVNESGQTDVSDAVLLARLLAQDSEAVVSAQGKLNADCDGNPGLSSGDTIRILRYLAKLITEDQMGKKL